MMNDAVFAGGYGIFSLLFCCIYIVFALIGLAVLALWIWMLIDVITRDDSKFGPSFTENAKLIWLLLILLTGGIGAIVYYFVVYKKFPKA